MPYEYKIEKLRILSISYSCDNRGGEDNNIKQTTFDLNRWARDGWELVSVAPAGAEWLAFLKRPVR